VTRISGVYWAISIIIGLISLPVGVLIRLIPNGPCARVFDFVERSFDAMVAGLKGPFRALAVALHLKKKQPKADVLPVSDPEKKFGVPLVLDNLQVMSTFRGGRMRSSSIVGRSRTKMMEKHDIRPVSLMSIVPSLVLSSVGVGWRPDNTGPGTLSDPAASDPSASSA
jgi:Ca2+-transporting ATPase